MPEYIIKTIRDRNLVIEAERYNYNATEHSYEFFSKDGNGLGLVKVATVPYSPEILAIVKEESEKADFYDRYDVNEDEDETDVCLGCQYADLLGSDEFFEAVAHVIDAYNSPEYPDDPAKTPNPQESQ